MNDDKTSPSRQEGHHFSLGKFYRLDFISTTVTDGTTGGTSVGSGGASSGREDVAMMMKLVLASGVDDKGAVGHVSLLIVTSDTRLS
jgi:hypothetical protein